MKRVGIIGMTGRMGSILSSQIESNPKYVVDQSTANQNLSQIFEQNDYVVDFSSAEIIEDILKAALECPKPLILLTTGWDKEQYMQQYLQLIAKRVPVVIAPNTSLGSWLQNFLSAKIASILDESYDIDIIDKHHKSKVDRPSGTTNFLISSIKSAKIDHHNIQYDASHHCEGLRKPSAIEVSVLRSGNLPGEHEVIFTSQDEMISIKHTAFNRELFAKGAIRILDWLNQSNPIPGIYGMGDLYHA
jgi:4-hydroxy-tetrahydrodipicolinate reductase